MGVFAGKVFGNRTMFGESISIIIDDYLSQEIEVINYLFESHFNYFGALFFGPALMINHMKKSEANVQRMWLSKSTMRNIALKSHLMSPYMTFQSTKSIEVGGEIYFTYGDERYFAERGYHDNFVDSRRPPYTYEELTEVGHCITNIFLNASSVLSAGKGVFSKWTASSGETISVSPVLVLPKHALVNDGRSSILLNYCMSSNSSDVALLPTGTAAMVNHGQRGRANVGVRWHSWAGGGKSSDVYESLSRVDATDKLLGSKSAPLYVEYYALRDISAGEELLLWYGSEWERSWKSYLEVLAKWLEVYGDDGDMALAPQFRHFIEVPSDMFPPSFNKTDFVVDETLLGLLGI